MATAKKLGLSVLAVLSVLLVGSLAWAVADTASGNKTRERNGNMTGMRGGGFGGMHGMLNATGLNLPQNATRDEIKAAMEAKMTQERAAIDAAITAGDYNAWKTAVEKSPRGTQLTSIITEANYAKYTEMVGYMTKARSIATELGLGGNGTGMGFGKGMGGRGCPRGKHLQGAVSGTTSE